METVSTFGISHFFLLLICALPVEQDSRKVHVNAGDSTTSQTDDYSDLHSTEAQENCSANSESVCDTKSLVALGTGPRLEQPSNKDNKIISSMLSPQGDPRNGHQELGVSSKQKNPSAFKEPVCRLQSDEQSNHYLEVIGAATGYEHGFIEDVVSYNDSHVAKFGVCSSAKQKHRAMPLLRNLAFHIKDDAEMVRLRILHLTEVDWKGYNLQLQYKMSAEGGLLQLIEGSEMALLVFYLGRNQGNFFESGRGLRFSEVHSEEHQTVCFNEETKYIILSIRGNAGKCEEEQLCIDVSLKVRRHSSGELFATTSSLIIQCSVNVINAEKNKFLPELQYHEYDLFLHASEVVELFLTMISFLLLQR
ncbi:uncharacterized protein [Narcine bancroftii]|uniref:uncharacterized protein n=1 Tax=Narcine bancroftii TaxID=1343680 RepID=UPI003831A1AF